MFFELSRSDFDALSPMPIMLNDPFDYRPSALILRGRELLLEHLWGVVGDDSLLRSELLKGKMLGVMVAEDSAGRVGFLFGFSGLVGDSTRLEGFVPPIFDMRGGLFVDDEEAISAVSRAIEVCDSEGGDSAALRGERSRMSQALQRRIFESYVVVNGLGEERSMADIFEQRYRRLPPSGAGECAAPKLLHYALTNSLRPLQMGEFWVGDSTKGELRLDGQFYGACLGKCKPILEFVLRGVSVAAVEPALRRDSFRRCDLEGIYRDLEPLAESADYIVYDKPAGMLSVRGRDADVVSLEEVAQMRCGDACVVHRLDQATSGVIVFAKGVDAQRNLQRQFEGRDVAKRYVALVDGWIGDIGARGVIDFPLATDLENRPRQRVDFEGGKHSKTTFRVVSHEMLGGVRAVTRLDLKPHTGRTHQLRVHCAYCGADARPGLGRDAGSGVAFIGSPIVGDTLYGFTDDLRSYGRMCLHAQSLTFADPTTGTRITFDTTPNF